MKQEDIIINWIEFKQKCIERGTLDLKEQIKLFEVWLNFLN